MSELIDQMLRPDFYPHAVREVRLIQTHISWILLAGEFAYKVKKPVDLGFLDFSTLERRRHFCQEELRLNGRGAPSIYLEVVSITQPAPGTFRLGGDEPAVEYAVKMRRFPDEALLTEELSRGAFSEADASALARRIAAFHGDALLAPEAFGDPQAIRASIEGNYRHTERFVRPEGPQPPDQMRETRAFTDGFFDAHADLLASRVGSGRIRECHGDLHLGNICRWPEAGGLLLFDCIEFNETFRFVDVMYDVGFTAMDLRAKGRPDLANAFINEYAESSGDWEGLRVLPLYLCRQAYVRAKVDSLTWADPHVPAEDRTHAFDEAVRFYRLAWEFAERRPGRVLLMCGFSGSGKSTVARQIARRLGAIHLRSDAVRKDLARRSPSEQPGGLYSPEMSGRTYGRMHDLGLTLAREGNVVILDGTYLDPAHRSAMLQAARDANLPIHIVHCTAPMKVLEDRIAHRAGDLSDATLDVLKKQVQNVAPFTDAERLLVITVDTACPIESILPELIARLEATP